VTPLRTVSLGGVGLALLSAILIAAFALRHEVARGPALRGTPLDPPKTARDFVLTGPAGRPAHVVDRAYALTFLFFGYTHCPDECPLAMASLGRAYRSLTRAQALRTRVVFVTVDPRRDTPPVLAHYVMKFEPRFVGLTGSPTKLAAVWRAYGVSVDARSREIGHGDNIFAIDGRGRIVLVYPPDAPAGDLAADAASLTRR
jgi:protein SCO1/2